MYSPIIVFAYNRVVHLEQTIEALKKNIYAPESELFIFSDGPKTEADHEKVNEVRSYLKTITGFKDVHVVEREKNYGLANNIIDGVTLIFKDHEKVIVVEDDLLTSPYFLKFMNEALDLYEYQNDVVSIHGYVYPVESLLPSTFFLIDPGSWGWATWKDRWDEYEKDGKKLFKQIKLKKLEKEFNYDNTYPFTKMLKHQIQGKNSSWVIRWYAHAILNRQLTLYPNKSLVFHNGSDGTGTHVGNSSVSDVELTSEPVPVKPIKTEINQEAREAFKLYFKKVNPGIAKKIIRRIKRIFSK